MFTLAASLVPGNMKTRRGAVSGVAATVYGRDEFCKFVESPLRVLRDDELAMLKMTTSGLERPGRLG